MGSGGSRTLWSPSYDDGVVRILEIVHCSCSSPIEAKAPMEVSGHHLAEVFDHASRADDDGGTLKREMSN